MRPDAMDDRPPKPSPMVGPKRAAELRREAVGLPSLTLDAAALARLELILSGALLPVAGYLGRADCESVAARRRLVDGTPFPLPLALEVPPGPAIEPGRRVVLRDGEGAMLAVLTVEETWPLVQGEGGVHVGAPGRPSAYAVGGSLEGIALPVDHDYPSLRAVRGGPGSAGEDRGPAAPRAAVPAATLAVDLSADLSPRLHAAAAALARAGDAEVLLPVAVGGLDPADRELHRRVRHVRSVLPLYPYGRARMVLLSLPAQLPADRDTAERSLLLRVLVYRRCGATAVAVEPAAAGLGSGYAAAADLRGLAACHAGDLGVALEVLDGPPGAPADLGGGVRGTPRGHVQDARQRAPRGFTCLLTGLPGAGSSTLARALATRLGGMGRAVTLLDGDLVRRHLSSEPTFGREHRDLDGRRIGRVASEVTRHGGIAVCAPVAPYRATRAAVRAMVAPLGGFLEIYLATPIEECEGRDPKGLHAKARVGPIEGFTGVDDPYEEPEHPELVLDTSRLGVWGAVESIVAAACQRCGLDRTPPMSWREARRAAAYLAVLAR